MSAYKQMDFAAGMSMVINYNCDCFLNQQIFNAIKEILTF